VPHSVFVGRIVAAGEPQFLAEDTDGAVALAEEEADTCPSCGFLREWCRDPAHQFAFDAEEEVCWASYRLALRRRSGDFQRYDEATRDAVQLSAAFSDGREPDMLAGLELEEAV
jgi:hypothetical protein